MLILSGKEFYIVRKVEGTSGFVELRLGVCVRAKVVSCILLHRYLFTQSPFVRFRLPHVLFVSSLPSLPFSPRIPTVQHSLTPHYVRVDCSFCRKYTECNAILMLKTGP
jgi:hypothetical protein